MRVLMTGGTSGIGLVAARDLLDRGHEVVMGVRRPQAAPADLKRHVRFVPMDLGDLASVSAFADTAATGAGALLLNAGMQAINGQRSAQGFELTFATNHLAHLYLVQRLSAGLVDGGRIVLTASGVHDPEGKTGMPPPYHADARRLAFPETDPEHDAQPAKAGRRAYSASKLCNVMTARELARRLSGTRPDLAVASFDPGFNPGTGLARDYGPVAQALFKTVLPLVIHGEHVSSPRISGRALAELVAEPGYAAARGGYYSMRSNRMALRTPSVLARTDAACTALWEDSMTLLAEAGFAPA